MATGTNSDQTISSGITDVNMNNADIAFISLAGAIEISSESLSKFNRRMTSTSKKLDSLLPKVAGLTANLTGLSQYSNELSSDFSNLSSKCSKFLINLNSTTGSMDEIGSKFTAVSSKVDVLNKNISDMPNSMKGITKSTSKINKMCDSAEKVNKKLKSTESITKKVGSALKKAGKFANSAKSFLSIDKIKSGTDIFDKYIKTSNALSKINDGSKSSAGLMNQINDAASRSGTSSTNMADAVLNIGSLDTFKSNDSAIAFTELMQKSLKLGGSDQSITDVTKSLSDGALQGDEFSSLISSAPKIGEALSASTGKSISQLQEMADQGMITADLLKNSMFAAGSEIDKEYGQQPKTFADIWTQITNSAQKVLSPIMELVSNLINNEKFQTGIDLIMTGLGTVAQFATSFIDFVLNNGELINALLLAIGVVMIGVLVAAAVSWLMMYAPILLIIAVLTGIIYMLQSLGVSFEDVFGFIGGVVGVAVAGIYNLFFGLLELVLGIINHLVNPFLEFGNFIANFAKNPISSIIYLFQGMADNVLGVIETIASALDFVFGTKMADTVSGWRTGLKDMADTAVETFAENENYQDVYSGLNLSVEELGLKRMEYGDAWNNGVGTGKDAYSGIENVINSLSAPDPGYDYNQFDTDTDTELEFETDKPVPVVGTVDMEDEDLDYLRKMAERDYIANIATNTLAPNISVSFGDVHETADVNQLFGRIKTILQEQIAVAPEGVY